eukprot:766608-Hanusia_phi.AAC.2
MRMKLLAGILSALTKLSPESRQIRRREGGGGWRRGGEGCRRTRLERRDRYREGIRGRRW